MLKHYLPWVAWGVALWGVLKLNGLKLPLDHVVCGPWGCGPPAGALLACHGAWIVLLAPMTWFSISQTTSCYLRFWGLLLVSLGVVSILGVGLYEALVWLPQASDWMREYYWRRWLFSVVTLTDYPILQSVLMGSILLCSIRWSQKPEHNTSLL